jgi:hypothetical protein
MPILTKEGLLMPIKDEVLPQYLVSGDPLSKTIYQAWLNNLADDATVARCWTAPYKARRRSGQS